MSRINVVVTMSESVTIDLGECADPFETIARQDWDAFDDAIVRYFDAKSDEELREMVTSSMTFDVTDPVDASDDSLQPQPADVTMREQ